MKEIKNVIGYCRVSTEDQKNNSSLDWQAEKIREHCAKIGYNIIHIYQEDYSGKGYTIDRPLFKEMYDYCKKHKKEVYGIVFLRWDRFTRNTEFLLRMRREIYEDMGIQLLCIENPINLEDDTSALLLGINGGVAEKERKTIVRRTTEGILAVQRQGKCTNKAPYGYINRRDGKDTWVEIDSDDEKAKRYCREHGISYPQYLEPRYKRIQQAFYEVSLGQEAANSIHKRLCSDIAEGSFYDMLKNPFYAGKIAIYERVKAPSRKKKMKRGKLIELVDGQHEALISSRIFDKVQQVMAGNSKSKSNTEVRVDKSADPTLYLRRIIACPECGQGLTGGYTKGYNGTKYPYYWCVKCGKEHRPTGSRPANEVNEEFAEWIGSLVPHKEVVQLYDMVLADIAKEKDKDNDKKIKELEGLIQSARVKIENAVERAVEGIIERDDLLRIKAKYNKEIAKWEEEMTAIQTFKNEDYGRKISFSLNLLTHLKDIFSPSGWIGKVLNLSSSSSVLSTSSSILGSSSSILRSTSVSMPSVGYNSQLLVNLRLKLISSIFSGKLRLGDKEDKTKNLNEVMKLIYLQTKQLRNPNYKKTEQPILVSLFSSETQD